LRVVELRMLDGVSEDLEELAVADAVTPIVDPVGILLVLDDPDAELDPEGDTAFGSGLPSLSMVS
jgi:ABC-type cobalamin transport system ATPase subunit